MIPEKANVKLRTSVVKYIAEIAIAPAFEQLITQFADAESAVHMRLAKMLD